MAKIAIFLEAAMQVTATEAKNRFGYLCARAKTEPVIVEREGRPDTVLIGYEEYQALRAAADRKNMAQRRKAFNDTYGDWIRAQTEDFERNGLWSEGLVAWQKD
jgi:prevent-host-death family protein